jgi:hypothetical protein
MPKTIEKALQMAIVATCAEQEEKAPTREDRGARVFAVGGSRESMDESCDRPGMEKSNGAVVEVPVSSPGLGDTTLEKGERGLTPTGQTIGLQRNPSMCGPQEGARSQDRRAVTTATRRDHETFNVIIAGCMGTFGRTAVEGEIEV